MTETTNTLPRLTRGVVYLIMGAVTLVGVALIVASVAMPFVWEQGMAEAARANPNLKPDGLMTQLYIVFALLLIALGIIWTILRKLNAIVGSVATGDPFVTANAVRLRAIGWLMVAVQVVGIPLTLTAQRAADMIGENDVRYTVSISAVLATLLVFILADVFQRGADMRADLEGMV